MRSPDAVPAARGLAAVARRGSRLTPVVHRFDRALAAVLVLVVLGFVAHRALVPLAETDLFFHLKIGDLIVRDHAIPFRNLFSFTYPDAFDPDLCWAFQVLVSLLYRAGGFPAIVLTKGALIVLAALLVHLASRRAGASPGAAAIAVVVALCAADQRLVERPHLVTFVGLGALSLLLASVRLGRGRLLWLVPPLVLVWANFHAGVFLCAIVASMSVLGAWGAGRQPLPGRQLVLIAVLACAATVATPAGWRLLPYLAWHTGLGATRNIEEFRHANAYSDPWFFLMMALCLASALKLRRAELERILCVAVVAVLAWRSVRFVAEWAFLATPLVALGLDAFGQSLSSSRWRRAGAVMLCVIVAVTIGLERRGRPRSLGLDPEVVPFSGIAFVTEHGLRERLYHDLDVGCYLLWEGWPRYRVFQDARLPAYPDAFHRALDETPLDPAAFDALLTRYGVDTALLNEPDLNMRAGSFDPDRWALVYREADALVFARRLPRFETLIARFELPVRMRFAFVGGSHAEPMRDPPARSPVARCEWDRRVIAAWFGEGDPERALDARVAALEHECLTRSEEADVRFHLGARAQRAGQLVRAIGEYDQALALEPEHRAALENRAHAKLAIDPFGAIEDFARARSK